LLINFHREKIKRLFSGALKRSLICYRKQQKERDGEKKRKREYRGGPTERWTPKRSEVKRRVREASERSTSKRDQIARCGRTTGEATKEHGKVLGLPKPPRSARSTNRPADVNRRRFRSPSRSAACISARIAANPRDRSRVKFPWRVQHSCIDRKQRSAENGGQIRVKEGPVGKSNEQRWIFIDKRPAERIFSRAARTSAVRTSFILAMILLIRVECAKR